MRNTDEARQVIKEGELEKRSENFLQLWKKKTCALTPEGLVISDADEGFLKARRGAAKELRFDSIKTVDCVERKGKYVYFTIVTEAKKEIDFRCHDETGWNAQITLALVQFKNERAVRAARARHGHGGDSRASCRPGSGPGSAPGAFPHEARE
uniref:pleckstrin homology-like domain family A member 2 n=1 Tax=Myxine glutinosa TaxID=7769 RepID=UPI00358E490B